MKLTAGQYYVYFVSLRASNGETTLVFERSIENASFKGKTYEQADLFKSMGVPLSCLYNLQWVYA